MKDFLTRLLDYYSISNNDYIKLTKELSYNDFEIAKKFKNIEECANFLKQKIQNNTKILIYGDYDCDGFMATSIMYLTLESYGYKSGYYIPFREKDGYGITKERIDFFYNLGYKLIILVDNGISKIEEIDYLNSLGMECIIFDHHEQLDILPKAKFIIHPLVSNFSNINTSAGAVCFYFSTVFLNAIDPYLLALGSISVISDMMPLLDHNRTLVKHGLKVINENRYKQIFMLINNKTQIDESDIGFSIAPKINAIGRIVNDNSLFNGVKFFISHNDNEITKLGNFINNVNILKRELVSEAFEKLSPVIENNCLIEIIDAKEGLTSLIANKYLQLYNVPTIVLVKNGDILKGSIRSKKGFNVFDFLTKNKELFINQGGHELAGGLTLLESNFEKLKSAFSEYSLCHPLINEEIKAIKINLSEINFENYQLIKSLSPFGENFKAPIFEIDNYNTKTFKFSKNGEHIITPLNFNSSLVYFSFDKEILTINYVSLYGKMNDNLFNNRHMTQFEVISFKKK